MELIFLDRNTLQYKDHGFVDSTFEVNLDLVIIQKSSFVVNKTNINASIGDIVTLKDNQYFYLGIIETLELTDKYTTTVRTLDFKEIFNIDIPVESFSGDVASFLESIITKHFISSTDKNQNLPYIEISKEASVQGNLNFEKDKIMSIQSVIELITKSYGVNLKYEVLFIRGRITGIKIRIVNVSKGLKIKSNLASILDLVINDSESQLINKVVFYPKSDNTMYKSIQSFFLLTNGEITQSSNHILRYKTVNLKSFYYSDNEYNNLLTKARSEMLSSKLDHNISFNIKMDNHVFIPLENVNLGDFVEFITEQKVYDSVVTGIKFKDGLYQASVTLGEYRIRLTDKIQLLNKNVKSTVGNISISSSGITDLDGGEY
jgi:hypothetical protein